MSNVYYYRCIATPYVASLILLSYLLYTYEWRFWQSESWAGAITNARNDNSISLYEEQFFYSTLPGRFTLQCASGNDF